MSDKNIVWLKCSKTHWFSLTVALFIPTAISAIAAIYFNEVRFISGIVIGLWVGMAHNCLWALVSKHNNQ